MPHFLRFPISPLEVDAKSSLRDLLKSMGKASFQGRNLGTALEIWEEMLGGETTIFLGLAGAMVPAGMRKVVSYLIEKRLVDCLVSTGANLFHDCHESLSYSHFQGAPWADDLKLKEEGIDRIYDTFAREEDFRKTDGFIADFASTLDSSKCYTTREFLGLLGEQLCQKGEEEGILTSSFKANVPIYCPAIGDSSIGIALVYAKEKNGVQVSFDVIADVLETAKLVADSISTGVVYIGGGTPKNFIQQTEVTASVLGWRAEGHKYAVQIITEPPHWGGLSGATFEEAQSWGKIAEGARKASVVCDATIALPLLVTALAQEGWDRARK